MIVLIDFYHSKSVSYLVGFICFFESVILIRG